MIRRPLALFAALLLSGCPAVGPDYEPPQIPVPRQWTETTAATGPHAEQLDQWWKAFNDPVLDKLISDAIASNLDLKLTLERVKDARALRSATIAAGLPSLDARSNVSRRFNNTSSPASQTGGTSAVGGGFGIGNQFINIFQMGFDAQWELDFFGGVRRAVEVADATIDVEVENSRDVLVTLLGDVARNYIELRTNQRLIAITRENLQAQQETQELTQIRQQTGLTSMLEVAQAEAQTATTEAQLPNYETLVKQSIHALSVLLGKEPGALAGLLEQQGIIPIIADKAITNLPSELLQRRPDIRRAERQLAVANASVGVATAELYPKINLAAFIGLQNTTITDFTPIGKSWSAASSLTMPIFNWGKLNANIESKKAQFEQTFLTYQSTVLSAFKEVEDALIAYSKEQERHKALTKAVTANRLAIQLANERYQKGLTSFLDVLISQAALYQAQSNLVSSEGALSNNLVVLYKALGGGWKTEAIVVEVKK
ncbi:efflux transporter outer membrane subunit [Methylobacter sp.]|uniref:efflux transporter outer membrane subunit n=1 Tax=Methylobacter sp. TaxID=2051955 RepID=UPI0011FFD5E1|nr:efflux transporter outer membrane subunit [Methylobacter sp.]TAK62154.1 MAG: efflux transporter outer membrane subunit [Methylobacter sp.]